MSINPPSRILCSPRFISHTRGFSLVELLICAGLVTCLLSLGMVVMKSVSRKGDLVREVRSGKSLITAYLAHATDHGGRVMVGHYYSDQYPRAGADPEEYSLFKVTLPGGEVLGNVESSHYTYRVAAYLDYQVEGVAVTGSNLREVAKLRNMNPSSPYYGMSMYPSFGINNYFTRQYLEPTASDRDREREQERLQRLSQVPMPAKFLVFASTASQNDQLKQMGVSGGRLEGFHRMTPPNFTTSMWETENQLDARHQGNVLCVFLDGSVRRHSMDELRDMRHWSYKAQLADNANYVVPAQGSTGIGGGGGGRR